MKKENTSANTQNSPTKLSVLFFICLFQVGTLFSQEQVYDNFEGSKVISYGERSGVLDSAAKNPGANNVNSSAICAMYVRNGSKKFANLKMNVPQRLTGVQQYATYEGVPPRLKLKVYTTAPAGTLVEVLLGSKRGNNDYPAGTHSQYQAYTSVSNEWEELEFKFSQIPQGSETAPDQIDQIVLLFNPNSSTSDTYYFDDLTGPRVNGEVAKAEGDGKSKGNGNGNGKDDEKEKTNKSSGKKSGKKK